MVKVITTRSRCCGGIPINGQPGDGLEPSRRGMDGRPPARGCMVPGDFVEKWTVMARGSLKVQNMLKPEILNFLRCYLDLAGICHYMSELFDPI